tara:strand:- start:32 stop:457 length:426 start_codon:yes stop_codon:yes gene_type:complete
MRENPIYTVTPPDMLLPESGPVITILSSDKEFILDLESLYENIFKTVPITLYHPGGVIDDTNSAWSISMINFSDTIYVDLDNISELGLVCAVMVNNPGTVYINKKNKRKSVVRLLNTNQKINVYEDIGEYAEMMLDTIEAV